MLADDGGDVITLPMLARLYRQGEKTFFRPDNIVKP